MSNDVFEKIALEKLKTYLLETIGLNCNGYRPEYFKRRLDIRLKATNSKSYSQYLRYLKANPPENKLLLNDLTVNYTSFFRDSDLYEALRTTVFPDLLKSNVLRIWSAGCATGEEPYSLAMLFHEILKDKIKDHYITIHASDIDREVIAKASKGEYTKNQLHGVDEALLQKYFYQTGDSYTVKEDLKRFIRFRIHDLMTPFPLQNFDLILCRNVMIYFSRESQQKIHMLFYKGLRQDGYFVAGKAEMLSGEPSKKFTPVDVKCRIYRKFALPVAQDNSVEVNLAPANLNQTVA